MYHSVQLLNIGSNSFKATCRQNPGPWPQKIQVQSHYYHISFFKLWEKEKKDWHVLSASGSALFINQTKKWVRTHEWMNE